MGSFGINARTGKVLRDFDHVLQSVEKLFLTKIAERVMRRWVYGGLVELLGRRMTPRRVALFVTLIKLAIDTYEPRLKVASVRVLTTSPDVVRLGELQFEVLSYYRPNGHRGDFTIEGGLRTILVGSNDNRVTVTEAAA